MNMDFRNWETNRLFQYLEGIKGNASKQHIRKEVEIELAWRQHADDMARGKGEDQATIERVRPPIAA